MPNYQNSKIYKLISPSGLVYYGSTTVQLSKRKGQHKSQFIGYKNNKHNYVTSFKLFEEDIDNVDIILVEAYACNNNEELHRKEREYIDNNACVNKQLPSRTKKEYREDNKEKAMKYQRAYYEEKKDEIIEQQKQYRENNKECLKEYRKKHYEEKKDEILEQQKQYREKNKDKKTEYNKEYREKNKDKINKKIICECGASIVKRNIQEHKQTLKHKKYELNKQ